ncbi:hypothetical protein T265_01503 [Opisthorchis viverrini]|uniref:Uncharacterized protein n=1 Tax=Opisthorchis viverrini TaxID=6198 RepID=A0A075A9L8_OPIVI|nr:hypothetical protein T265_01503 [Opisthorchis viverrini]KER32450.1 hypothetical protein T265_01503 [Opisthorchis viverrini]
MGKMVPFGAMSETSSIFPKHVNSNPEGEFSHSHRSALAFCRKARVSVPSSLNAIKQYMTSTTASASPTQMPRYRRYLCSITAAKIPVRGSIKEAFTQVEDA